MPDAVMLQFTFVLVLVSWTALLCHASETNDNPPCKANSDCKVGQYCDGQNKMCWDCDTVSVVMGCTADGGDCCSADFQHQCPSNPYGCKSWDFKCTTPHAFAQSMRNVADQCCEDPKQCNTMPEACDAMCKLELEKLLENCDAMVKTQSETARDRLRVFHDKCKGVDDSSANNQPDFESCTAMDDCTVGTFCDDGICSKCEDVDYADSERCPNR